MTARALAYLDSPPEAPSTRPDLLLRAGTNWSTVWFFAVLAILHLCFAPAAFIVRAWEGYLSLSLGVLFTLAAVVAVLQRMEVAILPSQKLICLRRSLSGVIRKERSVPFSSVQAVRMTLETNPTEGGRVDILCNSEEIKCPPTRIPRQQALYLAIAMGVRLIKVYV